MTITVWSPGIETLHVAPFDENTTDGEPMPGYRADAPRRAACPAVEGPFSPAVSTGCPQPQPAGIPAGRTCVGPVMDIEQFLATHDGVVSRAQARECGLTDDQIRGRLASGRWLRRLWGV